MYIVPYPNYVYPTQTMYIVYPTQTMYIVPYPNYVYCTLPKLAMYDVYCTDASKK